MMAGRDYDVLHTRINAVQWGTRKMRLTWVWHPMLEDAEFNNMVGEAVSGSTQRQLFELLVIPAGQSPGWLKSKQHLFDKVWQLRPHVTSDADGPYASLRAEKSFRTTLASSGLQTTYHFWPGLTLQQSDYVPVLSQEQLLAAWATYSRGHIPVTVNEIEE